MLPKKVRERPEMERTGVKRGCVREDKLRKTRYHMRGGMSNGVSGGREERGGQKVGTFLHELTDLLSVQCKHAGTHTKDSTPHGRTLLLHEVTGR